VSDNLMIKVSDNLMIKQNTQSTYFTSTHLELKCQM
jgi:hypothetical protein